MVDLNQHPVRPSAIRHRTWIALAKEGAMFTSLTAAGRREGEVTKPAKRTKEMTMDTAHKLTLLAVTLLAAGLVLTTAEAGDVGGAAESQEALAKAAQNPIANMISVPFQNTSTSALGQRM